MTRTAIATRGAMSFSPDLDAPAVQWLVEPPQVCEQDPELDALNAELESLRDEGLRQARERSERLGGGPNFKC
jgi:hypothetical protein